MSAMNHYDSPRTISQLDPQTELETLRRRVRQLERDNHMLAVINQNAEQLRRANEAEKNFSIFIMICC